MEYYAGLDVGLKSTFIYGGIEMCIHGLPLEYRIVMQRAGDKADTDRKTGDA